MDAKYVIATNGKVAIFSKYLGMEHIDVAHLMDAAPAANEVAGAGFCSMVGDQIITFGRSTSTGVSSRPEDANTLTSLLHTDKLTLIFIESKLGYIATNAPNDFEHDREMPCSVKNLEGARIFK